MVVARSNFSRIVVVNTAYHVTRYRAHTSDKDGAIHQHGDSRWSGSIRHQDSGYDANNHPPTSVTFSSRPQKIQRNQRPSQTFWVVSSFLHARRHMSRLGCITVSRVGNKNIARPGRGLFLLVAVTTWKTTLPPDELLPIRLANSADNSLLTRSVDLERESGGRQDHRDQIKRTRGHIRVRKNS